MGRFPDNWQISQELAEKIGTEWADAFASKDMNLLSPTVLRREMVRILWTAKMIDELDENIVTPLVGADDSVRLVFNSQFVDITAYDRSLSLDEVSEKIQRNIITI